MTPRLVRLVQNLRGTFPSFSLEELYQVVVSLRGEFELRQVDALPEVKALEGALLVALHAERAELDAELAP